MNEKADFTHTVVCFSDANARRHFTSISDAVDYANGLLRQQKKCKIYAYRQPMRPVDYAAARLERDGRL
jgi:hypothetical protein